MRDVFCVTDSRNEDVLSVTGSRKVDVLIVTGSRNGDAVDVRLLIEARRWCHRLHIEGNDTVGVSQC